MSGSTESRDFHQEMPNHQPDRVQVGSVVRVGLGLAAVVMVAMIGTLILFHGLDVAEKESLPEYASQPPDSSPPPPPQLDPAQPQHLRALRAEHQRILSSYAWIDAQAGIARIPIDRAMERLADTLPARDNSD